MGKVFRWVEIARNCSKLRFNLLSDYLNDKGFKNEFTQLEISPVEFEDKLKEALAEYDAIRLGSPFGIQSLDYFEYQPAEVAYLRAADSIVKRDGRWELMASALKGFEKFIRDNGTGIDLDYSVLIVGSGAAARFAIHALLKIGIKHINLSNQFSEQAKELIAELNQKYFGVDFEYIPDDQLVLLPGTNTVLVNTTPLVDSNHILKELYYFNFLRTDGLVIDYTFLPLNTPLIQGAVQIGINAIHGYEICAWSDLQWAKNFTDVDLDYIEYRQKIFDAGIKWEEKNLAPEDRETSPRF